MPFSAPPRPEWDTRHPLDPQDLHRTVVEVDAAARLVTTRDADGQTSVFEAPRHWPPRSWPLPAGDVVTVTFYEGAEIGEKRLAKRRWHELDRHGAAHGTVR